MLQYSHMVFDPLVRWTQDMKFEPRLAEKWERLDEKRASRIAIYRDGMIDMPDSELEEIREWHIENLLKLKQVFAPEIKQAFRENPPVSG
jgi:hypothetical protein